MPLLVSSTVRLPPEFKSKVRGLPMVPELLISKLPVGFVMVSVPAGVAPLVLIAPLFSNVPVWIVRTGAKTMAVVPTVTVALGDVVRVDATSPMAPIPWRFMALPPAVVVMSNMPSAAILADCVWLNDVAVMETFSVCEATIAEPASATVPFDVNVRLPATVPMELV